MCGIVGIFGFQGGPLPRVEELHAMAGTLIHRGPDSDGFLVDAGAALGYRRLSIIDIAGGHQPIFNEDGSVAVFQNGEIYNFRELRAELELKGHTFRTSSDTEVIAHLYEQDGQRFPERLRGMFAIAVLDRRQRRLLLARDRIGKKPLYYAVLPGALLFASELKALLAVPSFPRAIDETALLDYFAYRAVPAPKTIFRAARKLPPGHLLIVDADGVRAPSPYWRLSFADPFSDPPDRIAERLRELLDESVRLRLVSDVPLGAFLSGGVDSSAVVATMVATRAAEVRTFSVGFDDPALDERQEARATAAALGTVHVDALVPLDPQAALEVLPWHFDEPFSDASAVPTYAVSKLARQQVTVMLSGDGGDENFAGYQQHAYDRRSGRLRGVIPTGLRPLLRSLVAAYPQIGQRPLRGKILLQNLAEDPIRAYFRLVSASDPAFVLGQLHPDIRQRLRGYDPFDVVGDAHARADAPDPVGRLLQTDLTTYLPNDILTKVDRASMAASLEVRSPLLDQRFVEFAARIPSTLKLHRNQGKWIFRHALRGLVPHSVLVGPKRGFGVPLRSWTHHQLRAAIEDAIHESPAGLFDRAPLAREWQRHLAGAADHSEFFWAVLMLDRWRRCHAIPMP